MVALHKSARLSRKLLCAASPAAGASGGVAVGAGSTAKAACKSSKRQIRLSPAAIKTAKKGAAAVLASTLPSG